jgi:glucan-binding YG repeat protein
MKFDMKKRILALALAGTTAFSVFGAAMSANATSTHTTFKNDEYVSYTDLAVKTITAAASTESSDSNIYSYKNGNDETVYTNEEDPKIDQGENSYYKQITSIDADEESYTLGDAVVVKTALTGVGMTRGNGYYNSSAYDEGMQVGDWVLISAESLYETGTTTTVSYGTKADTGVTVYTTDKPTVTDTGLTGKAADDGKSYTVTGAATGSLKYENAKGTDITTRVSETWNLTLTDIMDVTVVPGTVYLYDFYYTNDALNDFTELKSANGSNAELAAVLENDTTVIAETGLKYVYKDERIEVLEAWEDFLYELGIEFYDDEDAFVSSYVSNSNYYFSSSYIDLYNIDGLLSDIYALNTENTYKEATTSQLIYLMQQYDKYVGNYFAENSVELDAWGDLLVELLQAADEGDFKTEREYRYYTNKVEDLVDAYETATNDSQINVAEAAMYDYLTGAATYKAAATADKTELAATLNDLYFNNATLPSTYTTAATSSTGAKYSKYGMTGTVYTLYPMSDYYESSNSNVVYPGNTSTKAYVAGTSTDEYEWFWNVYQLAYNMNKSNKYQGSVDAVNEALEDAVAALSATKLPAGSNVLAKEEMVEAYAGLIESDYNANYYALYTLANEYAEVAEGAAQTKNATEMVKEIGNTLGYQSVQTTVTKNDITALKASIKSAKAALTAIKESSDYSAAQVTALNKAIDAAQNIVDLYEGTAYSSAKATQYTQSVDKNGTVLVGDKDQFVKSDLTAAEDAIDAAINYSEVVMGWSKNSDGAWQYGEADGYVQSGWKQINSVWYYFENGVALQSTWKQIDGKWYYLNSNCGAAYGWAKVDGSWYYFGGDNAMKTGWVKVDGSWYYLNAGGKMVTGWAEVNGTWYYFSKESNALGQMLANTTTPDGYTVDANGALVD